MNNEEFQKTVLEKLSSLEKDIKDFKDLKTDVKSIKTEVKGLNQRFDSLENRVGLLGSQTGENTQMLKALIHSSEVHKAELDNITLSVARIEGDVSAIKKDLSMVETITANNYSDIVKLKAIR